MKFVHRACIQITENLKNSFRVTIHPPLEIKEPSQVAFPPHCLVDYEVILRNVHLLILTPLKCGELCCPTSLVETQPQSAQKPTHTFIFRNTYVLSFFFKNQSLQILSRYTNETTKCINNARPHNSAVWARECSRTGMSRIDIGSITFIMSNSLVSGHLHYRALRHLQVISGYRSPLTSIGLYKGLGSYLIARGVCSYEV